jgi:hypothetical protein
MLSGMEIDKVLAAIDEEIQRLEQARGLLSGLTGKRGGRRAPLSLRPKKRTLSAEARAKIAAAQRARWAKAKKAAK